MSTELLKQQLNQYYQQFGNLPSLRKLAELLGKGANYRTQISRWVETLIVEGFLAKDETGKLIPGKRFNSYPLLYGLKAGSFAGLEYDDQEYVNIENYLVNNPSQTVLISVAGDSMKDAGIHSGDVVIVEKTKSVKDGDVVVANYNGEFTVKFLARDAAGNRFLQPGNATYSPIYFEADAQVEIVGRVVSCIRKYN